MFPTGLKMSEFLYENWLIWVLALTALALGLAAKGEQCD